jgi:hypothetical protein
VQATATLLFTEGEIKRSSSSGGSCLVGEAWTWMIQAAAAALKTTGQGGKPRGGVCPGIPRGIWREGHRVARAGRNSAGARVVPKDGGFSSATRSRIATRRFCQTKPSTPLQASLRDTEAGDLDARCLPARRGSTPQ